MGGKFQDWMPVESVASTHGVAVGQMWTSLTVTTADGTILFSGPSITDGGVDAKGFQWMVYEFTLNVPLVANQSFTVNFKTRLYAGTAMCNQTTADTLNVAGDSFIPRFQ
ncbi:hypothetical protein QO003_003606 [Arthrobacter silviterrae]|nr:hypothetical protein [Arthrobacter silviterrae]